MGWNMEYTNQHRDVHIDVQIPSRYSKLVEMPMLHLPKIPMAPPVSRPPGSHWHSPIPSTPVYHMQP
jgi:hypothetical protein